jgi:hypothetical protein
MKAAQDEQAHHATSRVGVATSVAGLSFSLHSSQCVLLQKGSQASKGPDESCLAFFTLSLFLVLASQASASSSLACPQDGSLSQLSSHRVAWHCLSQLELSSAPATARPSAAAQAAAAAQHQRQQPVVQPACAAGSGEQSDEEQRSDDSCITRSCKMLAQMERRELTRWFCFMT